MLRAIVKVQVAIVPRGAPAMIYDRERRRISYRHLDRATTEALGEDLKGYFDARWLVEQQRWDIGRRVEDQSW